MLLRLNGMCWCVDRFYVYWYISNGNVEFQYISTVFDVDVFKKGFIKTWIPNPKFAKFKYFIL